MGMSHTGYEKCSFSLRQYKTTGRTKHEGATKYSWPVQAHYVKMVHISKPSYLYQ